MRLSSRAFQALSLVAAVTGAACNNSLPHRTFKPMGGYESQPTGNAEAMPQLPPAPAVVPDTFPDTLADLKLFKDGKIASPAEGVWPYEVRAPLWSDGAVKSRFLYIPAGQTIAFDAATKALRFPVGTHVVKHFALGADGGKPVETRVLALRANGQWDFMTYVWQADGTATKQISSLDIPGLLEGTAAYHVPSTAECRQCHSPARNWVLGFSPEQLNFAPAGGENQLAAFHSRGLFADPLATLTAVPAAVDFRDASADLDARARSYFDVNCATCHFARGVASLMDLSLAGLDPAKLKAGSFAVPKSPDASRIWVMFNNTSEKGRMPPVSNVADPLGKELIQAWIQQLPDTGTGTDTSTDTATSTGTGTGTGTETATSSSTSTATGK